MNEDEVAAVAASYLRKKCCYFLVSRSHFELLGEGEENKKVRSRGEG